MATKQIKNDPVLKIKALIGSIDQAFDDTEIIAMVRNIWDAGRLAQQYREENDVLLEDLAVQIGLHKAMLQRYCQFYRLFPEGAPESYDGKAVTWSNIVEVLPVRSHKQRIFYLKEACRNSWSKHTLKDRIKSGYYNEVKQRKTDKGVLKVVQAGLYTYAAQVIKVIDGDTFDLEIDVGFRLKSEHRVRLRGINAPEIGTAKGKKAKAFIEAELEQCVVEKPLFKGRQAKRPLVVVKTFKQGVFGRYIVDLYYKPGSQDAMDIMKTGYLLNQVLIDKNLAKKI